MMYYLLVCIFFFQAEDGIRDFCLSRGLGMCIRDSVMMDSDKISKQIILAFRSVALKYVCDGKRVDVVNEVSVCVAASNSQEGGGGENHVWVSWRLCSGWVQHNGLIGFLGRCVIDP